MPKSQVSLRLTHLLATSNTTLHMLTQTKEKWKDKNASLHRSLDVVFSTVMQEVSERSERAFRKIER